MTFAISFHWSCVLKEHARFVGASDAGEVKQTYVTGMAELSVVLLFYV